MLMIAIVVAQLLLYLYIVCYVCIYLWLGWGVVCYVALAIAIVLGSLFSVSFVRAAFTSPGYCVASPVEVVVTVTAEGEGDEAAVEPYQSDDPLMKSSEPIPLGADVSMPSINQISPSASGDLVLMYGSEYPEYDAGSGGGGGAGGGAVGDGQGIASNDSHNGDDNDTNDETAVPVDPSTYCETCALYKPPRTHHCSACNKCTLRMDHHCVWIENCVGSANHKFFYLTVLYAWLGAVYGFSWVLARWIQLIYPAIELALFGGTPPAEVNLGLALDIVDLALLIFYTLLLFGNSASVSYMMAFHTYLLVHGRTNVEHVCCRARHLGCNYDRGSCCANVRHLLGEHVFLWLVPIAPESASDDQWIYYTQLMEKVHEQQQLEQEQQQHEQEHGANVSESSPLVASQQGGTFE